MGVVCIFFPDQDIEIFNYETFQHHMVKLEMKSTEFT